MSAGSSKPTARIHSAPSSLDGLIAGCDIGTGDAVLVLGRNLSEHLVALARHRCRSAMGFDPSSVCAHLGTADVVWIAATVEIDRRIRTMIGRLGQARLVVVELPSFAALKTVRPLLHELSARGFSALSYRRTGDRSFVTARRMAPMQRAA